LGGCKQESKGGGGPKSENLERRGADLKVSRKENILRLEERKKQRAAR